MCEVGDHRKGLIAAGIIAEITFPQLTEQGAVFRMEQNYTTSWNLNGSAAQPTDKISLAREPEVLHLDSVISQPQLEEFDTGRTLDIGGSTGGTSRVVIDGYTAPKIRR